MNREYVTAIKAVSTDGHAIPTTLILSGAILQDHYFDSLNKDTGLAVTETGYLNNKLALSL
jgi:hypothetical protein